MLNTLRQTISLTWFINLLENLQRFCKRYQLLIGIKSVRNNKIWLIYTKVASKCFFSPVSGQNSNGKGSPQKKNTIFYDIESKGG